MKILTNSTLILVMISLMVMATDQLKHELRTQDSNNSSLNNQTGPSGNKTLSATNIPSGNHSNLGNHSHHGNHSHSSPHHRRPNHTHSGKHGGHSRKHKHHSHGSTPKSQGGDRLLHGDKVNPSRNRNHKSHSKSRHSKKQRSGLARACESDDPVGGKPTTITQYAFYAAVVIKKQERYDGKFKQDMLACASSIIGPKWALTSSSCVVHIEMNEVDESDWVLRTGSNDWTKNNDTGTMAEYSVDDFFVHPNYRDESYENDIALLRVNGEFKDGDKIKVKLAGKRYRPEHKSSCEVVGFGLTMPDEFGLQNPSYCMKKVNLEVADQGKCKSQLGRDIKVTNNMVCASSSNSSTKACFGDTGGPLVQNNVLFGIVTSLATQCTVNSTMSTFTKVSSFHDWIKLTQTVVKEDMGVIFED